MIDIIINVAGYVAVAAAFIILCFKIGEWIRSIR